MRYYLYQVLKYHDNPRTVSDFINNVNPEYIDAQFLNNLAKVGNLGEVEMKMAKSALINSNSNKTDSGKRHQIHYAEQEFSSMDWQCSQIDPRWKNTLSIIVLRHPIERHLSEFFYSGPGSSLGLDAKKLYSDKNGDKFRNRVRNRLIEELPNWLNETGAEKRSPGWYFGRHYTDNFQLRALAGCAHGDCLHSKQLTAAENTTIIEGLEDYLNVSSSPSSPNGACTMYFSEKVKIIEPCRSYSRTEKGKFQALCPRGCDTPCRYPVAAWGSVQRDDLTRAISSLKSYDAVFLTETLDHDDQSAFLADMMGVPQNETFSLGSKNTKTKKTNERERTHFYRDLLMNLTLTQLYDRIHEENSLEIELFDHAVKLNQEMTRQWKEESGWEEG
jgi:hypothetical protein